MGKDIYNFNKEEGFEELRKTLSELPRVNTPDNFEFNLLTRIQNKQFDLKNKEEKVGWSWIYAPATALVMSAVLLFFVFSGESDNVDNPLLEDPLPKTELIGEAQSGLFGNIQSKKLLSKNSAVEKSSSESKENYVVVLQPNDVVVQEKVNYPFNENSSVDLDNMLGNSNPSSLRTVGTAGRNRDNVEYFEFDGFYTRIENNNEALLKEKARIDSLKSLAKEPANK
ncbi:MAG: hypothetical protein PVH88_03210 [Ignavibacteria bacterium]